MGAFRAASGPLAVQLEMLAQTGFAALE
jgi:hypothetical protein